MSPRRPPFPTPAEQAELAVAMVNAQRDVERLHERLAGEGGREPADAIEELRAHWSALGATHRAAARLGEEVRAAVVAQLHGHRRQLRLQLALRRALNKLEHERTDPPTG